MILDDLELEHFLRLNVCISPLVKTVRGIICHITVGVLSPPNAAEYRVG